MRARPYHVRQYQARYLHRSRLFKLFAGLILLIVLAGGIWKLIISNEKAVMEDYLSLASIPPEIIIALQKDKPDSWKDYASLVLTNNCLVNEGYQDYYQDLQQITIQLDQGRSLQKSDWSGIDRKLKSSALNYRKIFDKYPMYTPGKYSFPLEQTCYYIDTYGADREGGARSHQGTDLFDQKGTPILSVSEGTVERIGWNRLGGERVGVRGKDGNYYYYAHLDTINPELRVNQIIKPGELIGTMGNTGDAITTPDHLHFGIELPNGEWLNPYSFLKVWEYHNLGAAKESSQGQ